RRRERGQVAPERVEAVVRAVDHRHRVPPDVRTDATLEELVTGEPGLLLGRDGVDVVGAHHRRDADALLARPLHEPGEQVARPRTSITESRESSHSPVSSGSTSGSWCTKPSMNTGRPHRLRTVPGYDCPHGASVTSS